MFKDKGLLIGTLITILLIGGGVFYFSKGSQTSSEPAKPVSSDILIPKGDFETSGFANGSYLAATDSAKVTLVEFGDYECPACGQYHPLVKQLLTELAGKVNYVFRNFPLTQHANSQISAQAVEAAGLQGKFWQMHDKVYESQNDWSTSTEAKNKFISYASSLGLNVDQYKTDIDSSIVKDKVANDLTDGALSKVNATPTFYINGVQLQTLPSSYAEFKKLVTDALAK